MKANHTHLTLLVDRSGSMGSIRVEAEQAINQFIAEQKAVDGTASLILADFDGHHSYRTLYQGDIDATHPYALEPRGMTALFDAVGNGIVQTGIMLDALDEADKPSKVFFVIVTDGGENSSTEFTGPQVRNMVSEHENTYSWEFVFLASGLEAQATANAFAGTRMHTNNTMRSAAGGQAYGSTYSLASSRMASSRATGQTVDFDADIDADGNVAAPS